MELDWKAVGIGILVTIIATFFAVSFPQTAFLGPIIGGLVAVYYAKNKDLQGASVTGAFAGGLGYAIYSALTTYISEALFGLSYRAGLAVQLTQSGTNLAIVTASLILGIVLGAIGGLFGTAIVKK